MAFLAVRYIMSEQCWEERVRNGQGWEWLPVNRVTVIQLLERGYELVRVDVRPTNE